MPPVQDRRLATLCRQLRELQILAPCDVAALCKLARIALARRRREARLAHVVGTGRRDRRPAA